MRSSSAVDDEEGLGEGEVDPSEAAHAASAIVPTVIAAKNARTAANRSRPLITTEPPVPRPHV